MNFNRVERRFKKMKKFNELSKKQKMFILPLFALILIGGVLATGYVVNHFSVKVGVAEPFGVSYAILGDAGNPNWQSATSCDDAGLVYVDLSQESQPVDFGTIYAGEHRTFCTKIQNDAEVPIHYTVSSVVQTGLGNYNDCVIAFPETTNTGTASANTVTIDEASIDVPQNAPTVSGCIINVSVARG